MVDLASACLVGVKCRYDGESRTDAELLGIFQKGGIIPVCPELLGGLQAPRPRMEMEGGKDVLEGRARVVDEKGDDRTKEMIAGAMKTLAIAEALKPDKIFLKSKSPSCGVEIDGLLGVAAAALRRGGFNLISIG